MVCLLQIKILFKRNILQSILCKTDLLTQLRTWIQIQNTSVLPGRWGGGEFLPLRRKRCDILEKLPIPVY